MNGKWVEFAFALAVLVALPQSVSAQCYRCYESVPGYELHIVLYDETTVIGVTGPPHGEPRYGPCDIEHTWMFCPGFAAIAKELSEYALTDELGAADAVRLEARYPGVVRFNPERGSIQLYGCQPGTVIANIPLSS